MTSCGRTIRRIEEALKIGRKPLAYPVGTEYPLDARRPQLYVFTVETVVELPRQSASDCGLPGVIS